MFSKKAGFIVLVVLLLLSQHSSCKGPLWEECRTAIGVLMGFPYAWNNIASVGACKCTELAADEHNMEHGYI